MAAWENRKEMLADATLLVNTTALGMKGQPALELPLQNLPAGACVYDIVYSPLSTPLLEDARARGCRIITGLGMLLYQAQPAFEAWFGVRPEVTPELHEYMLEALT
jgi:shikimate dehydrogenase